MLVVHGGFSRLAGHKFRHNFNDTVNPIYTDLAKELKQCDA